nr:MAG TPA: hypothetical protein [Caudoviricetes sp.]
MVLFIFPALSRLRRRVYHAVSEGVSLPTIIKLL